MKMNESLKKAIKEALRIVVIAIIPIIIDGINKGEISPLLVGSAAAIALLRFIDKLLHETGIAEKGITRF